MINVVLAGGGTAGHTSPLIATAQAVQRATEAAITVIGTPKGLETRVIPEAGLPLELVDPVPLPRSLSLDLVKLPYRLTKSVAQARRILRRSQADVVVGFGGYASIPAYLAAKTLGIPVIVHEANRLPGVANKVGARFAVYVASAFGGCSLPGSRTVGLPIKRSITHPEFSVSQARAELGLDPERPTLVVSGGSQGARSINNAIFGARDAILAQGIQILHVLGAKNVTEDTVAYTAPSGASYLPVPFISDMALVYTAADLMIGRAGAGTVIETAVSGVPVIFVPLPWGNGEQGKNATELIDAGAGILVPDDQLSSDKVAALVTELFTEPGKLEKMSALAKNLYPADAADVLAEAVLAAVKKPKEK